MCVCMCVCVSAGQLGVELDLLLLVCASLTRLYRQESELQKKEGTGAREETAATSLPAQHELFLDPKK